MKPRMARRGQSPQIKRRRSRNEYASHIWGRGTKWGFIEERRGVGCRGATGQFGQRIQSGWVESRSGRKRESEARDAKEPPDREMHEAIIRIRVAVPKGEKKDFPRGVV